MMKVLIVYTSAIKADSGDKVQRDALAELFSNHSEVVLLRGLRGGKTCDTALNNLKKIYFFRGKVGNLTDLNIDFMLKLRRTAYQENIDIICVAKPFGIVASSFICRDIPIIYDATNVAIDSAETMVKTLQDRIRILGLILIRRVLRWTLFFYVHLVEKWACNHAAHIICVSELDKKRFIEKYGVSQQKITVIPPYVNADTLGRLSKKGKQPSDKVIVIFHGHYSHLPNRQAFNLIQNYLAPEVMKRTNKVQFLLAGTDLPKFKERNVESLGHVNDLSSFLEMADIAVVPLLEGTGIKIKLFDYMQAGLPIITTSKGIEGLIEAENGKHAIILDEADEKFVDAILDLAGDKEKREKLGRGAIELVRSHYSREIMQERMDKVLNLLQAH